MTLQTKFIPLSGDHLTAKLLTDALYSKSGIPYTLFDPELLYVECRSCGQPVLWEPGKTTEILLSGGVNLDNLDDRCLIVTDTCPLCHPGEGQEYTLAVVRIAGLTPDEALHMQKSGGHA